MIKHQKININWIGFPKTRRRVKCVYMIEDFYIGATTHVRERILSHIAGTFNTYNFYKNLEEYGDYEKFQDKLSKVQNKILEYYNKNHIINVTFLDEDPYKENEYIDMYKLKIVNDISKGKPYSIIYK